MATFAELMNKLAIQAFDMTLEEAHAQGVCLNCKETAIPKCYSQAGILEYQTSGMCEACFDEFRDE